MLSPHIKRFKKQNEAWLELVSLPHFSIIFEEKYIFFYILLIDQISLSGYLYLCEILGNMCIATVCKPIYDVMNFEVNLIFLIKPFFPHDQKVVTRTWISWERKELLRWNKKHFSSFLKEFFLEGKSPALI